MRAMGGPWASDDDFLAAAFVSESGFQGWGAEEALEEFRKGRTEPWEREGNAHTLVIRPTEATIALEPFKDGDVLASVSLTHDQLADALGAWTRRR